MARVLLISYPGYPSTPAHLVANAWLSHLLGALLEAGHEALALDFGTVTMMRRLFPEPITQQLKHFFADPKSTAGLNEQALSLLEQLTAQLEAHQALVEAELTEQIVAQVERFRPQLVLWELGDGDGFPGSMAIAAALRARFPHMLLGVGGRKACWFRHRILNAAPHIDVVIYGDPEHAACDLAEMATKNKAWENIPGIIYRTGSAYAETPRQDFPVDDLPSPCYDPELYPALAGDEKIKMGQITESRGCNNRCAFCSHPYEDGDRQRLATPQRVVDIMHTLKRRYGMSVFRFCGASTPMPFLYEVAREIVRRGLKVQYNSFGHFRQAQPAHIPLLAQSGLYSLFFGLESGSQEILNKAVHKGVKLEQAKEIMAACQQAGIFTAASMIVPLPFDTDETLAESLAFVLEAKPDAVPLQFPALMPGSKWFAQPQKYHIEIADREAYLSNALDYKVKLLFPPPFWTPLPYKINGMDFAEFTGLTMWFAGQLEKAGILTNFSHILAAIAQAAGMAPRQLRDAARYWFLTGDAEGLGAMIARVNAAMIVHGDTSTRQGEGGFSQG